MRIAMVAPLELRVPPPAYGGTELVVSLLTEELVRRGHEVTLFASGDSITSARLHSICPTFLRGSSRNKAVLNLMNVRACLEQADRFEVIHNHTVLEGIGLASLTKTPMLTTLHGAMNGEYGLLFETYRGWHNTISDSAKSLLPPQGRFVGTIYNSIESSTYPFNGGEHEGYMLFLSRISIEKGTHIAIEVAKRLNRKLIIAGNVDDIDRDYFQTRVLPGVDGDLVRYVGEADYAAKRELLKNAYCLLAPITWAEPFGLFLIEAMACGTPVIANRLGSVPEVVQDGVTGFVVDSVEHMVRRVADLPEIDPAACRRWVETHFSVSRMVDGYLAAYETVVAASARAGSPPMSLSLPLPLMSTMEVAPPPVRSDAPAA